MGRVDGEIMEMSRIHDFRKTFSRFEGSELRANNVESWLAEEPSLDPNDNSSLKINVPDHCCWHITRL